jgi:hypothetical protein
VADIYRLCKMLMMFSCIFQAEHGKEIGWKPQYKPEHIIETADEEVDLILQNLRD